ncbi:MAG: hypothetical protein PHQ53_03230 [Candidatus Krumholzibacteria bacterium]|nr:hypothetical protein [Candidatus Krumholzibacteria bacterium]
MKRLIQTVAVGAALVAVASGIWLDYGALLTLKRAVVAYLAAYFLGGIMYLAGRAALRGVRDPDPEPEPDPQEVARADRQRRRQVRATGAGSPPSENKPAAGALENAADVPAKSS